ncbi:hypothetical protein DL95DRAFT_392041 [Leptodontidium sp. 2 PMI_412]|nr:hypothetical protein DL95DRAFT_392041 [Leptodontidium sp. 2 PMI_412]
MPRGAAGRDVEGNRRNPPCRLQKSLSLLSPRLLACMLAPLYRLSRFWFGLGCWSRVGGLDWKEGRWWVMARWVITGCCLLAIILSNPVQSRSVTDRRI